MQEIWLSVEQVAHYERKAASTIRRKLKDAPSEHILPQAGRGKRGGSLISSAALSPQARRRLLGDPHFRAATPNGQAQPSAPRTGRLDPAAYWLSARQAAALLPGTSAKTLKRWCREGKIARWRKAGGYQIHLHSLPDAAQIAWYLDQGLELPDRLRKGVRPTKDSAPPDALDDIPAAKRKQAIAWAERCQQFARLLRETGWTQAAAAAAYCETEPRLRPGTLLKKYRAWKRDGLAAVVPGTRTGRPRAAISDEALAWLYEHYLRSPLPNKALSARACLAKGKRMEWQLPSAATLARYLDNIPEDVRIKYQGGQKALANSLPSMLRNYTFPAMECWVSDHHQCNAAVIAPDGRVTYPWLSAWLDMRSRKLMGWMICLQPNSDTIAYTLYKGLVAFGGPRHVLTDNGKDYKCRKFVGGDVRYKSFRPLNEEGVSRLKGVFEHLGITPHFAIPYNAKSKSIERFFRTFNEQFAAQLPGYRGRNVKERPEKLEAEIKRGDLLSLDDFVEAADRWITEVYHAQPHRGHGMNGRTPDQVFEAEKIEVAHIPRENLRLLKLRFGDKRKYSKNGVQIFGEHYRAADGQKHLELKGEWFWVRYDPADLRTISVSYLKDDTFAAELTCKSRTDLWSQQDLQDLRSEQKAVKTALQGFYDAQTKLLEGDKIAINDRVGLPPAPPTPKAEQPPAAQSVVRLVPRSPSVQSAGQAAPASGDQKIVPFPPASAAGPPEREPAQPADADLDARLQAVFGAPRPAPDEDEDESVNDRLADVFGF